MSCAIQSPFLLKNFFFVKMKLYNIPLFFCNLDLWYQLLYLWSVLQPSQNVELLVHNTQKEEPSECLFSQGLSPWVYCRVTGIGHRMVRAMVCSERQVKWRHMWSFSAGKAPMLSDGECLFRAGHGRARTSAEGQESSGWALGRNVFQRVILTGITIKRDPYQKCNCFDTGLWLCKYSAQTSSLAIT